MTQGTKMSVCGDCSHLMALLSYFCVPEIRPADFKFFCDYEKACLLALPGSFSWQYIGPTLINEQMGVCSEAASCLPSLFCYHWHKHASELFLFFSFFKASL